MIANSACTEGFIRLIGHQRAARPAGQGPCWGLGREAGTHGIGDAGRPLVDLGPVPEVPLGDAQGRHDCPLGEAELLADQLAGEDAMLAAVSGGEEVGRVDGVFLGLGGSPTGPLENSHTGRAARPPACRSTSSRAGFSQCPA